MRIGELAQRTGASVRSLRYYEECGLLDSQRSGSGAHRVYDADAVDRVRLLRQLYSAGLSSTVIASILPCVDAPSTHVTEKSLAIMQSEHARLREQMQAIAETQNQLSYLIACADEYLETSTPARNNCRRLASATDPVCPDTTLERKHHVRRQRPAVVLPVHREEVRQADQ